MSLPASIRSLLDTAAAALRQKLGTPRETPSFSLFTRALIHPITQVLRVWVNTSGNLVTPKESALSIAPEATTSADTAGAALSAAGGAGNGSGAGGAIGLTGGAGGATGAGGAGSVTGGAGGATSGAGGAASLVGGAATAGNSAGGAATMTGGAGKGTSAGGAIGGTSGAGANGTSGTAGASGAATLTAGAPGTATTGTGGAGGTVGAVGAAGGATSGASGTGGAGSKAVLTGGAGGASAGSTSTGGAGGSCVLTPGAGGTGTSTNGKDGANFLRGPVVQKITVTAMTDTGTISTAAILGGQIAATPTAAATYTTPTGTVLEAALPADPAPANGDAVEVSIQNLATNDAYDITLAAGASGITFKFSNVTIEANSATTKTTWGTLRFVRTGSNTFDVYRLQ